MSCKRKVTVGKDGKRTISECVEKGVQAEIERKNKGSKEPLDYTEKGKIRNDVLNGIYNLGYDPND